MTLIEAFETGNIEGINGCPERVIETYTSKIFLYSTTAYKVYKHKANIFIKELGDTNAREKFYHDDFSWNHAISPTVYIDLLPMVNTGNVWAPQDTKKPDDYAIKMVRFSNTADLTHLLATNAVTREELRDLGKRAAEFVASATKERKPEYTLEYKMGWKTLMDRRLQFLKPLDHVIRTKLTRYSIEDVSLVFKQFIEQDYFTSFTNEDMVVICDFHSDNVVRPMIVPFLEAVLS